MRKMGFKNYIQKYTEVKNVRNRMIPNRIDYMDVRAQWIV